MVFINPSVSFRVRTRSRHGDRIVPTYKPHFENDGSMNLKKSGQVDIYEEIQSHKASCDINMIIKRFTDTGDTSLFQVRQAYYGDFTEMPKTIAEMYQRLSDAEGIFNGLKSEIKEQFNNSVSEFLAAFGSDKFMKVFAVDSEKPVDEKKEANENAE